MPPRQWAAAGGKEVQSMGTLRSILVTVDYTAGSRQALRRAVAMAGSFGARLVVLHVVPPNEKAYFEHVGAAAVRGKGEEEERKLSAFAREEVGGRNGVGWEAELAWGDPAEEIIAAAARRECDLVVIGSGRRTVWNRLRVGSVAGAVVRKAPCPVLVVPEKVERGVAARRRAAAARKITGRVSTGSGEGVRLAV